MCPTLGHAESRRGISICSCTRSALAGVEVEVVMVMVERTKPNIGIIHSFIGTPVQQLCDICYITSNQLLLLQSLEEPHVGAFTALNPLHNCSVCPSHFSPLSLLSSVFPPPPPPLQCPADTTKVFRSPKQLKCYQSKDTVCSTNDTAMIVACRSAAGAAMGAQLMVSEWLHRQ